MMQRVFDDFSARLQLLKIVSQIGNTTEHAAPRPNRRFAKRNTSNTIAYLSIFRHSSLLPSQLRLSTHSRSCNSSTVMTANFALIQAHTHLVDRSRQIRIFCERASVRIRLEFELDKVGRLKEVDAKRKSQVELGYGDTRGVEVESRLRRVEGGSSLWEVQNAHSLA